jgi:hypothetical protein
MYFGSHNFEGECRNNMTIKAILIARTFPLQLELFSVRLTPPGKKVIHLNLQNYWVYGLFPSSGILETRKHDVSETGSLSVLR